MTCSGLLFGPDIPCDEVGSLLGWVHCCSLNVSVLVKCLPETSFSYVTAVKLTRRTAIDVFRSVVRTSLHMRSMHFALSYVTLCCDYLGYGTLWSGRLNNDYQTAQYQTEDQNKPLF